jgi:hypothetical protein
MTTKIQTKKSEIQNKKGFSKFCQETSLPGWSYLNYEMSRFWKVLWIVFLCLIIGISVYVIVENTRKYFQAKKDINVTTSNKG